MDLEKTTGVKRREKLQTRTRKNKTTTTRKKEEDQRSSTTKYLPNQITDI
jgi:hypothetical protein